MSELPDIDTTTVGVIGYWNAIDQGGASSSAFDAEDVLANSSVNSSSVYDNGVDIQWQYHADKTFKMRVKSDGWVVCWLDRTNNYTAPEPNPAGQRPEPKGFWLLHAGFTANWSQAEDFTANALSESIKDAQSSLSATPTFDKSDVGYYYYPDTNATNITGMSDTNPNDSNTERNDFSFTASTNVHYAAAAGSGWLGQGRGEVTLTNNSTTLVYNSNEYPDANKYGSYNLLDIPITDGTTYTLKSLNNADGDRTYATLTAMWS